MPRDRLAPSYSPGERPSGTAASKRYGYRRADPPASSSTDDHASVLQPRAAVRMPRDRLVPPPGFRLASGLPPLRRATVRMPQHRPAHSSSTDDCAFRPATASRDADAVRQACPRFPPGERPSGTPASKKRRAKTKRRKNRKLADYEKLSKFAD